MPSIVDRGCVVVSRAARRSIGRMKTKKHTERIAKPLAARV